MPKDIHTSFITEGGVLVPYTNNWLPTTVPVFERKLNALYLKTCATHFGSLMVCVANFIYNTYPAVAQQLATIQKYPHGLQTPTTANTDTIIKHTRGTVQYKFNIYM